MSGTLISALQRIERASFTFLGQAEVEGGEVRLSAAALRERVARAAGALRAAGVRAGDRVLVVLPTSPELVTAFLGAQWLGAVPCVLSPPEGFGSGKAFDRRLEAASALLDPWGAVTPGDLSERVARGLGGRAQLAASDLVGEALAAHAAQPEDLAFLQLTSGTTQLPKAVRISHAAVAANTEQIGADTRANSDSVIVSWLPLFHDMGLMALLAALAWDAPLVLSTPLGFVCDPASWLRTIERFRATHSPAPTFAFRHLVQRARDEDLAGLDLSSWRSAFVGAEPIPPAALRDFAARLAPCGLDERALLPCYGMAEATLAITHKAHDARYRVLELSRSALSQGGRVAPASSERDRLELVSCGEPLAPTRVRVLDEAGAPLPEGRVGEIAISGPSLFAGYYGQGPAPEELRTGDVGFLEGGELFVVGRRKDTIILKGENHHPEEVEWAAAQVEGVRAGRVAAFGVADPEAGTERLCVVAELDRRAGLDADEVELALRRRVHAESGLVLDEVVWVRAVPLTTSGKVQRSQARELFAQQRGEA